MHWEMFPHKRSKCNIAYHFFELDNLVMKKSLINFRITDTSPIIVSDFIFHFSLILDSIVSSELFPTQCMLIQNWQKISVIESS